MQTDSMKVHALELALKFQLAGEIVVLGSVKRALDQAEAHGRSLRELRAKLLGLLHQGAVVDGLPDQAPFLRLLGRQWLGQQRKRSRAGNSQVPPASGTRPSRANTWVKVAERAASTMSQASAMLRPAPAAMPLTAQTTGNGNARSLSTSGL